MSEHVVLVEVRGESGALKVAWRTDHDLDPNERHEAISQVTGFYRRLYGEWGEFPKLAVRDETEREKKTFK